MEEDVAFALEPMAIERGVGIQQGSRSMCVVRLAANSEDRRTQIVRAGSLLLPLVTLMKEGSGMGYTCAWESQ